jgi:hypothetical protein
MTTNLRKMDRLQRSGLIGGALVLVGASVGGAFAPRDFFISYLIGYIFWFGLALGCLIVCMIHHLAGGNWGNVTRRLLEAGFMTLPLMAVLFIPLLFGLSDLYAWARPEAVAHSKILQQKAAYENAPAFIIRAGAFFAIWIFFAARLRSWSLRLDRPGDDLPAAKMKTYSGSGVVIVPLTATFAFVDWIMSIEPAWFSTIFAVILMAGEVLITFALLVIMLAWFSSDMPFRAVVGPKHFLDLGNFLLTFVMFWTYVSFSQFLIIYSGDQPNEIGWYLRRIAGGWKIILVAVALFHFFVPFLLLLFRAVKRSQRWLVSISFLLFFVHAAATFWMIAPTFHPDGFYLHWTTVAVWLGIGGIWLGIFATHLKRHPVLARTNVRMENVSFHPANAS